MAKHSQIPHIRGNTDITPNYSILHMEYLPRTKFSLQGKNPVCFLVFEKKRLFLVFLVGMLTGGLCKCFSSFIRFW
jgi:hypothetical protein